MPPQFYQKFKMMIKRRLIYPVFYLFLYFVLVFLLIALTNRYIVNVNFYERSSEPLAGDPAQDAVVYAALQHWIYLYTLVYYVIKFALIALILQLALYLTGSQVAYRDLVGIVIKCEFIFFIPAVIKLFWFWHFYPAATLDDWYRFYVGSALSLAGHVPSDWIYPLQALNIFEIAYWFLLALGIREISGLDYDSSLRVVARSYIPALLICVATVTFCSLLLSPVTG
jgi:hypothetical protein